MLSAKSSLRPAHCLLLPLFPSVSRVGEPTSHTQEAHPAWHRPKVSLLPIGLATLEKRRSRLWGTQTPQRVGMGWSCILGWTTPPAPGIVGSQLSSACLELLPGLHSTPTCFCLLTGEPGANFQGQRWPSPILSNSFRESHSLYFM